MLTVKVGGDEYRVWFKHDRKNDADTTMCFLSVNGREWGSSMVARHYKDQPNRKLARKFALTVGSSSKRP